MFKVIAVLFLTITVSFASFAFFFVPKRFHHQIHQVLIPKLSVDSVKTYTKINRSVHETKVQSEKYLSTVTSVTGLTPFDYHVVVKSQNRATLREIEFRIFGRMSENFELHTEVKDYNNEDPDDGLAVKKAQIVLETPTKILFVDEAKRAHFLYNNTRLRVLVKEIAGVWSVEGGLKESSSSRIDDLSWELRAESLQGSDSLKLISKLGIKGLEFSFPKNKGQFQNVNQDLIFDSFSKTGFKDNYLSLNGVFGKKDDSPFAYKLLTTIPLVKGLLTFPLEVTQKAHLAHPGGPAKLDFTFLIKDIEVHGLSDALKMNLKTSFPKSMGQSYIVGTLADEYAKGYKDRFYPSDINSLDTVKDYAEMNKLRALAEVKMKAAFEKFLIQEVAGKKRVDRVLDVAVSEKMLTSKDGILSLEASYERKKLTLGGKADQLDKLKTVIPPQEVGEFLLTNGFIQTRSPNGN